MLAQNTYPKSYIDACRAKTQEQLAAYRALAATSNSAALAAFEPHYFNSLVLVLDTYFSNRTRTLEGKDGNPINEVRVLCNAIMLHDDTMYAEKTIKIDSAKTILHHQPGDKVALSE